MDKKTKYTLTINTNNPELFTGTLKDIELKNVLQSCIAGEAYEMCSVLINEIYKRKCN